MIFLARVSSVSLASMVTVTARPPPAGEMLN